MVLSCSRRVSSYYHQSLSVFFTAQHSPLTLGFLENINGDAICSLTSCIAMSKPPNEEMRVSVPGHPHFKMVFPPCLMLVFSLLICPLNIFDVLMEGIYHGG